MTDSTMSPAEFVRSMPTATPDAVVAAAKKAGFKLETTYVSKTRGLDKARAARWGAPKAAAAAKTNAKPAAAKGAPASKAKTGAAKGRPKSQPKQSPKATAKAAPKAAKGGGASKADFIRSMPNASSAEVVSAAKKAGIDTNDNYVKWLRWSDSRKKGQPTKAKKTTAGGARKAAAKATKAAAAPTAKQRTRGPAAAAPRSVTVQIPPKHVGTASKAMQQAFVTSAFDIGLVRSQELLDALRTRIRSLAV